MSIRVDDLAVGLPVLPLDADVCTTEWPEALDEGRLGIQLGVLESGDEVVASAAHALDLGASHLEIELVFVGLDKAWITRRQYERRAN